MKALVTAWIGLAVLALGLSMAGAWITAGDAASETGHNLTQLAIPVGALAVLAFVLWIAERQRRYRKGES